MNAAKSPPMKMSTTTMSSTPPTIASSARPRQQRKISTSTTTPPALPSHVQSPIPKKTTANTHVSTPPLRPTTTPTRSPEQLSHSFPMNVPSTTITTTTPYSATTLSNPLTDHEVVKKLPSPMVTPERSPSVQSTSSSEEEVEREKDIDTIQLPPPAAQEISQPPTTTLNDDAFTKAQKRVSWDADVSQRASMTLRPHFGSSIEEPSAANEDDPYFHSDMSSDREQSEIEKLAIHGGGGGIGSKPINPFECTLMMSARNAFKVQENKTRAYLGCKVTMRLKVTHVDPAGAASDIGIQVGDVILGTNRCTFTKGQDFVKFMSELCAGDVIVLKVKRSSGAVVELSGRAGAVPIQLQGADRAAREVYLQLLGQASASSSTLLNETSAATLRSMLDDRTRFNRWANVAFQIVNRDSPHTNSSTKSTNTIDAIQFRSVIQLYANALTIDNPFEENIDALFQQAVSATGRRTCSDKTFGYLTHEETCDACYMFFKAMLEQYKPTSNPIEVLLKRK